MVLTRLKDALYDYLWLRIRRYHLLQGIYYAPFMPEICHYAKCPRCVKEIERQGWKLRFTEENGVIRELFFVKAPRPKADKYIC